MALGAGHGSDGVCTTARGLGLAICELSMGGMSATNINRWVRGSVSVRWRAYTLIELLVTVVIIGVVASLLMPVLGAAKRKAKSARCLSNLRQLGIATRLYADENEGRLPRARPFAQETNAIDRLPLIQQVLAPQVAGVRDVFRCPEDRKGVFEREGSSYEWNGSVSGRILYRIGEEGGSKTFLLRDREAWHFRGRKNAVFVDGHAGEFAGR